VLTTPKYLFIIYQQTTTVMSAQTMDVTMR
jgi:hypothetical protein